MDSWYGHGLMVLTTLMVLIQIHGIVLVLLNHTCTRGLSVARMRDFHRIVYYEIPGASGSVNGNDAKVC